MSDPRGIIGNYILEHELGRGGMGVVYAARHRVLGHRAAIKSLLGVSDGDHARIERFYNEARAAMAIRHPGVVTIHDVGLDAQGRPYIAMELLEGTSLAQLLAAGPVPVRVAVDYAIQIADALAAAHAASVIHRDLKPENIIVAPDRTRVTLVDFGVAKLAHAATVRTATGALIGTPLYMSPEQCEGLRELDARTDLYSLGCVLFALVTGRPPFDAPSVGALIGMHQHVAPPLLRTRNAQASEALERVVAVLLAKQPAERFRTAAAVRAALEAPEVRGLAGNSLVAATADVVSAPVPVVPARPVPALPAAPPPVVVAPPPVAPTVVAASPPPPTPVRASRRWLPVIGAGAAATIIAVLVAGRSCRGAAPAIRPDAPLAIAMDAPSAVDAAAIATAPPVDATDSPKKFVGGVPESWHALSGQKPDRPPPTEQGPPRDKPKRLPPDAGVPTASPDAAVPVAPPDAAPTPSPDAPPAERPRTAVRERITFAATDFSVSAHGATLDRIAEAYAAGRTVTIVGHAEQDESQRPEGIAGARANSVLTALVNRRVPRDAIDIDREVHPVSGDGAHRRVDIRVE